MGNENNPYLKKEANFKGIFYAALSVAIILVASAFFYYNVIHKPQLENRKIELLKIEQNNKIELLRIEQERKLELQRIEQEKQLELQRIEKVNDEKRKSNLDKEIKLIEDEYVNCKENAQATYLLNWGRECQARGLNKDGSLPRDVSDSLLKRRLDYLERCEREYKTKLETLKLKED